MTKVDSLRRLLPCISPTKTTKTTPNSHKKRLSTSLRDDIPDQQQDRHQTVHTQHQESSSTTSSEEGSVCSKYKSSSTSSLATAMLIPPRPSKQMVIGTFFGHRRGHVCFCIQHSRLNTKPSLFLDFSIPTYLLVKEMQCGLVRIALESKLGPGSSSCPLHSIRVWSMCINGRKVGFAAKRKRNDKDRLILKTMQSTTVGAGVIPAELTREFDEGEGELIYMRANYERVVASGDSESYHLINTDACPDQELSIFLMRS